MLSSTVRKLRKSVAAHMYPSFDCVDKQYWNKIPKFFNTKQLSIFLFYKSHVINQGKTDVSRTILLGAPSSCHQQFVRIFIADSHFKLLLAQGHSFFKEKEPFDELLIILHISVTKSLAYMEAPQMFSQCVMMC